MRERIFQILGVLSQCLIEEKDLFYDAQEIWEALSARGYSDGDIEQALAHLEKMLLDVPGPYWSDDVPVHRIYTDEEQFKLSVRVRGYLWRLKCRGIIDHALEDEIVHKASSLEEPASLREIKTVAALTVFGYELKFHVDRSSKICTESRLN